jgi:hypothetical protein
MPFHILLSQSLSLLTGGLEVWKLAKDVFVAIVAMFTICLVWRQRRGERAFAWFVGIGAAYAALHLLLWALHPAIYKDSALLGLIYNNRVWMFLIIGTGAALLLKDKINERTVLAVVLAVSTVVAVLGVAQYFLPHDTLAHIGYSKERGVLPAFFIDDRPNFPRVMSTLRDPNSLGAYLIVPMTLLTALLARAREHKRRLLLASALLAHAAALFLTFSRSAWIGALLAMGLLLLFQFAALWQRLARRWWPVLIGLLIVGSATLVAARNTYVLKSVVTHSTGKPKAAHDSNGFHWEFAKRGLDGIVRNPFGHGPGTAGLASIQNPKGSFLTENYYIQIGYEVGVLGLALFIALNVLVYKALWRRRDSLLAGGLLASFWAYVLINMLLHIWSNEAVAAQWWILAGLAIGATAQAKTKASKRRKV